jgi:membrane protease subunit HflC
MNTSRPLTLLIGLGVGLYVLTSAIYTVNEVEQVIVTQFGKPVGEPVTTAGLKVKVPFIQEINPIDKRVLEWDGNPSDMPTKDKLYISVDLFARWRITDPLQYFLRLRDERSAQSRLDDILGSETRNAVAKHELIEIIRTTRDRIPLRDALQDANWSSRKSFRQRRKRFECLVSNCLISVSNGSITIKACAPKSMTA